MQQAVALLPLDFAICNRDAPMRVCQNDAPSYVLRCQNNFLLFIHAGAHLFDEVAGDVFVVLHHLVDDAIGSELDDAVGYGLDELVVVATEEYIALIKF